MITSELIAELQKRLRSDGDLPVLVYHSDPYEEWYEEVAHVGPACINHRRAGKSFELISQEIEL